jgi:hypothetical protein
MRATVEHARARCTPRPGGRGARTAVDAPSARGTQRRAHADGYIDVAVGEARTQRVLVYAGGGAFGGAIASFARPSGRACRS